MRNFSNYFFLVSISFFGLRASAQDVKIPQPSSFQRIEQDLGLGQVSISYSRPNTKGRKIFNGMEPYGIVWRTGANSATKIKLTDTVTMEGHPVAPGVYSFFTIPGANEWTIILNKVENQWGAYTYDSTKDVLRFKVKSAKMDNKLETFTIQFANVFSDRCDMQLLWDNTVVSIHKESDADNRIMANIDQLMQGAKKPYYFASIYYYNHNKDMNKALEWITESEKTQPEAPHIKYWKSRILTKKGDKQAAIATATEGLRLAMKDSDIEYTRLNKEALEEAKK